MNGAPELRSSPDEPGTAPPPAVALTLAEGLNTSALLSMWLLARSSEPLRSTVVLALMRTHGWTSLRAWRHWRGYSKAHMARRLDVHPSTYELIEDGTVDLGPWLLPAVEKLLLD